MTDEQIFAAFPVALEDRIEPDTGFSAALYESLTEDLGLRAPDPRRRSLAVRLARAVRMRKPYLGSVTFRLMRDAWIVALLAALLVTLAVVAGNLLLSRSPLTGDDIVRRSQALYPDPPAFDMTVAFPGGDIARYRYDGAADLRTDVVAGTMPYSEEGPGSYWIETATQIAMFDAQHRAWSLADLPAPRPPLFTLYPLNWIVQKPYRPPEPPPAYECPNGWERDADGPIAGRPAYHVTCGSTADFWIDEASYLVVGAGSSIAATSLSLGAPVESGLYSLTMPSGAYDVNNPPPSTILVVGQPGPDWAGPLTAGGEFDSRSLLGAPAAIYFWAEWCDPCLHESLDSFAKAAREGHPGIKFVSVASEPADAKALQAAIDASGGGYLVVRDEGIGIQTTLGITAIPALVLLRADGTVASVRVGPLTSAALDAGLSALAAGEPIPSPIGTAEPCTCSSGPGSQASPPPQ